MELLHLPSHATTVRSRKSCEILCGERRSANRTRWSHSKNVRTASHTTFLDRSVKNDVRQSQVAFQHRSDDHIMQVWKTALELQPLFFQVDRLVDRNSRRVREACRSSGLGPHHFAGSSGYGHGDLGRDALDEVFARAFGAERAIVRHQFVSGTHAIAAALFGMVRPSSELIMLSGTPYDTLHDVIGITNPDQNNGSLLDWGVDYTQIDLLSNGNLDLASLRQALANDRHQVVYIQRSCGYEMRPTLSIDQLKQAVEVVKKINPQIPVLADNCYGEFTEEQEPTHVGVDLIMGSLIKNPGGTIVSTGGYVAGKAEFISKVNSRLSAPGIGLDSGSIAGDQLRIMFQGFCLAPQMVGEVLKSGLLLSHVLTDLGFEVFPKTTGSQLPSSFITSIKLGSEERMIKFCETVQKLSPVGSYIRPVPGVTSGYEDKVVFADGTFIDGSTSELSADGPIRPPFVVYCQGGTHWTQWAEILEQITMEFGNNDLKQS